MKTFSSLLIGSMCVMTSLGAIATEPHHANYKGYKGEYVEPLMPVTIPNFKGGFVIGLEAVFLKPSTANLDYVAVDKSTTTGGGETLNNVNIHSIDPGYTTGFLLQLGYIFPNTANDAQLMWMHLHSDNSASTRINGSDTVDVTVDPVIGDDDYVGLLSGDFINAHAKVNTKFDAVDLSFGQYINIGHRLQTRLFTGLRWARINNELSYSYKGTMPTITLAANQDLDPMSIKDSAGTESTFNGIGPLFGIGANYNVGYGIGISGTFDAALLVGRIDYDQSSRIFQGVDGFDANEHYSIDYNNKNVVSPAFDAKLGVNYHYMMGNGSLIKVEVGYQVTKYFDVIENANLFTSTGADIDFRSDSSNFGLNGPYVSAVLKM